MNKKINSLIALLISNLAVVHNSNSSALTGLSVCIQMVHFVVV